MHVLAFKKELSERHSRLPGALYEIFEQARQRAIQRWVDPNWSMVMWARRELERQTPLTPEQDATLRDLLDGLREAVGDGVDGGIDVDGRLNEAFYDARLSFDDLIQAVPVSRGKPSERTEVWIGFDASNVYVAARVWDSLGEAGWIANEMRRDSTQLRANDSFGIYFDTYRDRRNAVGFDEQGFRWVNPQHLGQLENHGVVRG